MKVSKRAIYRAPRWKVSKIRILHFGSYLLGNFTNYTITKIDSKTLFLYHAHTSGAIMKPWQQVLTVAMSTLLESCMHVVASQVKSVTTIQRDFRTHYKQEPSTWKSLRFWDKQLRNTGPLLHEQFSGYPQTCEENVNCFKQVFQHLIHICPAATTSVFHNTWHGA